MKENILESILAPAMIFFTTHAINFGFSLAALFPTTLPIELLTMQTQVLGGTGSMAPSTIISLLTDFGSFGFILWLVHRTQTHTIPRLVKEYTDRTSQQNQDFIEATRRQNDQFRETLQQQSDTFRETLKNQREDYMGILTRDQEQIQSVLQSLVDEVKSLSKEVQKNA